MRWMTETQNVAWTVNLWDFLVLGFLFTVVTCLKCPVARRTVIWHCSEHCTSAYAGQYAELFLGEAVRQGHFNK